MSTYQRGQFSGVGTDLFIKKNSPDQQIGAGYSIEIFLNGVKQEDILKRTKQDVIDFIKEQKAKYNTTRSFENASQVHVTYKTREERGEPTKTDDEGEHMASIDTVLLKQAADLEDLMKRLMSPDLPVKVRRAADDILNTNDMPAPSPDMQEMPVTPESVAKMLTDKLTAYVQAKPDAKVDELYNSIKHWISEVKKTLNKYETGSGEKIDRNQILDIFRKSIFEGQLDMPPEQQKLVQEVLSKKASISGNEHYNSIDKVVGKVNTNTDNPDNVRIVKETITNMPADQVKKEVSELHGKDKNFAETFVDKTIKDMEKDLKRASIYYDYIQQEKKAFFRYAEALKGTYEFDRVFADYVNSQDYTIDDAQYMWNKIQEDIAGKDKFACILHDFISFTLPMHITDKKAIINLKDEDYKAVAPSLVTNLTPIIQDYIFTYASEDDGTKEAKLQEFQGSLVIALDQVLETLYKYSFQKFAKTNTMGVRAVDDFVKRTFSRNPDEELIRIKNGLVPAILAQQIVDPQYNTVVSDVISNALSAAYTQLAKSNVVNDYLVENNLAPLES